MMTPADNQGQIIQLAQERAREFLRKKQFAIDKIVRDMRYNGRNREECETDDSDSDKPDLAGMRAGEIYRQSQGLFLCGSSLGRQERSIRSLGTVRLRAGRSGGKRHIFFSGNRGIPKDVTHIWARCFTYGFTSFEDGTAEIPERYRPSDMPPDDVKRFSILTDLHLSSKPWKIIRALRTTENDTVFLLGDSTNDGLPEQFDRFMACIAETVPDKTILPVTGNHDVLHAARGDSSDGCKNYADFQGRLLEKAQGKGYIVSYAPDGRAYSARIGDLDIIGLQCVTNKRMFIFPEGKQIDWLEHHIETTPASWHIVLCHAPLLAHNPNRNTGQPYLHRDKKIQEIVDRKGRVLFLSGHTHVSPNVLTGNDEYDKEHHNIYLDCGSVVATDTSGELGLMSPDWKDGCKTELSISRNGIEICMSSIEAGIRFPRGYYRFFVEDTQK